MTATPTNEYLRTMVMTASPEQLQLMLYDGALRFARQGRQGLAEQDFEAACEALLRAQKIILEMNASLRYDVDRNLCGRLASIYNYIYRRLVAANVDHDLAAADEAIELIDYQRQTWELLMEKVAEQRTPPTPADEPEATEEADEEAGVDVAG
jgi:flagellar protein FliS